MEQTGIFLTSDIDAPGRPQSSLLRTRKSDMLFFICVNGSVSNFGNIAGIGGGVSNTVSACQESAHQSYQSWVQMRGQKE